jgi:hypothetical protein
MAYTNPGPSVTTGSTNIGFGSPDTMGTNASSLISFYGVTPIVQPASATQAALTLVTASAGGYGFVTTTGFSAFIAQLENIRASLVLLGLLKGSA